MPTGGNLALLLQSEASNRRLWTRRSGKKSLASQRRRFTFVNFTWLNGTQRAGFHWFSGRSSAFPTPSPRTAALLKPLRRSPTSGCCGQNWRMQRIEKTLQKTSRMRDFPGIYKLCKMFCQPSNCQTSVSIFAYLRLPLLFWQLALEKLCLCLRKFKSFMFFRWARWIVLLPEPICSIDVSLSIPPGGWSTGTLQMRL